MKGSIMPRAINQDTTTTVTAAVTALVAATNAYAAAPEGTQDPLEAPMYAAYGVFLATPAHTPSEVLVRLKAQRWWDDELADDPFLDSLERDLWRIVLIPTAAEVAVILQLQAPRLCSRDPAEVEAIQAEADERDQLFTELLLAAPDPLPKGWLDKFTGGRAFSAVPTEELRQIVANLEAAEA
jgi:hypothetical protein